VETRPRTWIEYVVPIALFLVLTYLESQFPAQYVWLYIGKAAVVTAALIWFRATWNDLRVEARVLPVAILVGLAVFAEWVLIERFVSYPHPAFLGKRTAFDPFAEIGEPGLRWLFMAVRFYGLVLMVPLMEELFWRSFLIRFITNERFEQVPMGTYSAAAFWGVTGLFALAHPEWLVAAVCAMAYNLLLRGTKSLFACFVAHAVTNLALGIYVLIARDWRFW
jgi:CAAX prenyl protease-like protein